MYRMIVVEDKKITREGLCRLIDWETVNTQVVEALESGEAAISWLKQHPADIVLTDIEMDQGTGIELSEFIRRAYPQIKIIILTAFENFRYAQKAVELGVFAYILKPIRPNEVLEKVKSAVEALERERQQRQLVDDLKRQHLIKKIQEYLDGSLPPSQELRRHWEGMQGKRRFAVVSIKSGTYTHLSVSACQEMCDRILSESYVLRLHGFLVLVVVLSEEEKLTDDILNQLYDGLDPDFRVCAGKTVDTLDELSESLCSSYHAYNEAFLDDEKGVVRDRSESYPYPLRPGSTFPELGRLKTLIFLEREEYRAYVDQIFDSYRKQRAARTYILHQCEEALNYLYQEAETFLMEETGRLKEPDLDRLRRAEDFSEMRYAFMDSLILLRSYLAEKRSQKIRPVVKLALDYSIEHIRNPSLNLKTIADRLKISYAYLSKVFKQDFGQSYTEYMNRYRIEMAKRQLVKSDEKISEICRQVGLEDKNFYYLFKKYEGVTPKEYKEIHGNHE